MLKPHHVAGYDLSQNGYGVNLWKIYESKCEIIEERKMPNLNKILKSKIVNRSNTTSIESQIKTKHIKPA